MSPNDTFAQVSALIRRETSMVYDEGKEYLVSARLTPLANALGLTVPDYVRRLPIDPVEKRKVVDALTINETSWFRDHSPYQAFTDHLLPSILEARATMPGPRLLRVWSAACSSGQEAYSIAMLCEESLPDGWDYEIVATDISGEMVERVRAGRYSQVEVNRGLPATRLVGYFQRDGRDWQIADRLRERVRAQQANLAEPYVGLGRFDLVLLRNVLIYFEPRTKQDILRRMLPMVAPHGYLLLGSAETTLDLPPDLAASWRRDQVGRVQTHRPVDLGTASTPTTTHRLTATGA
ncbi:MAG: protein-glutamate O-methyltransferase CheR [Nocardioidaceae bacterium]|nr:protein-glutamate O-methyltransferase CheR [Nocardioidaceae bacterium]MCL2613286.1 protein-glutamate O-methyltransferase CheR [Nocardioidaceae bacterium]